MATVDGLGVVSTGHTHTCVWREGGRCPQGQDGNLSCVWSRSLAGGRVGGGWQTEGGGGGGGGGEERWEGGILKYLQWSKMKWTCKRCCVLSDYWKMKCRCQQQSESIQLITEKCSLGLFCSEHGNVAGTCIFNMHFPCPTADFYFWKDRKSSTLEAPCADVVVAVTFGQENGICFNLILNNNLKWQQLEKYQMMSWH